MSVSLALVKQHLRVDHDDEDALISAYLAAAISWVQDYTDKNLVRGVVLQSEGAFDDAIKLHRGPEPASVSVDYTDSNGAGQSFTGFRVLNGWIIRISAWPIQKLYTPIKVSYIAGYDVTPAPLDAAVLLLTGHFYANRESVAIGSIVHEIPFSVEALCHPYRSQLL